jgi:hypothetical protein
MVVDDSIFSSIVSGNLQNKSLCILLSILSIGTTNEYIELFEAACGSINPIPNARE